MRTDKIEAFLNLLMLIAIVGVIARFTNVQTAVANGIPTVTEYGRIALTDKNYELDEYETCLLVDGKSESICDRLVEQK